MRPLRPIILRSLALALGATAFAPLAVAQVGEAQSAAASVERPRLTASAPEWREDWLLPAADPDAPFYSHVLATLCAANSAGKQANVLEAVQRFRTKEAAEQFRGERGDALAGQSLDHPLVWSSAQAIAKVGEAAKTTLYVRTPAEVKVQEVPLRAEKARVPSRSRTCSAAADASRSQAVLADLGLAEGTLNGFTEEQLGSVSVLQGTVKGLSATATWTVALPGDGKAKPLALSTMGEPEAMERMWKDLGDRLAPLPLMADVQITSVNGANTLRDRRWQLADGRWLRLTLSDGQAQWGGERSTSLMVSLSPAS